MNFSEDRRHMLTAENILDGLVCGSVHIEANGKYHNVFNFNGEMCIVQCSVCSVQFAVCSVKCALCTVHCELCTVQCSVHMLLFGSLFSHVP